MRPRCAALALSVLPVVVPLASSIAQAGPSHAGIGLHVRGVPLVGRVQTRDGTFELTRESIAQGGSARHLAPSMATLMAEARDSAQSRAAQSDVGQPAMAGAD